MSILLEKRHMLPTTLVLPGVHFDSYKPSSVTLLFPHVLIYQLGHDGLGVDGEKRGGEEGEVIVLKAVVKITNSKSLTATNLRSSHSICECSSYITVDERLLFLL